MVRGEGTHRKQAPQRWEARGLTENKHPEDERRGDSPKTSTPKVRSEGTHRKQAPWRW